MINRQEFFKDKGLLFFIVFMEVVSMFLNFEFMNETYFFIVPVFMFGFLGILELWYIQVKESSSKNKQKKVSK